MKTAESCNAGTAAKWKRSGLEGHRFKTLCQQGLFNELLKSTHPHAIYLFNINSCERSIDWLHICFTNKKCNMSWTHITESTQHRIWLRYMCWQHTVPNTFIKNLISNKPRHCINRGITLSNPKWPSWYFSMLGFWHKCTEVKTNIENLTSKKLKLGTFSDICPEQCNRVLANFKNDDWYHRLLSIKVFSQFICHVCNKIVQKLDGFYQFGISCNQSILFLFCKISDFKKNIPSKSKKFRILARLSDPIFSLW